MAAPSGLLPAELRARLRTLAIVPRLPPPHGPLGQNASHQRGAGLEFSRYRAYEQGDEPRRIDWKLYARSDRYYVREAESEAALTVWVILDASASMAQADIDAPERDKWRAARVLAAGCIEVALRQGDRFGLLLAGEGALQSTPPGTGPRHRDRCLLVLDRAQPSGAWPDEVALRAAWSQIAPHAVVLMVGDGFEPRATELATRLQATCRDVRSIAISSVDERMFALDGPYQFEDPETGAMVELDAASVRASYLERFAGARRELERRLAAAGVRHLEYVLDQPLERPLRAVLGEPRLHAAVR